MFRRSQQKTHSQLTNLRCSFCGKGADDVKKLIAGPKVYICDECIEVCQQILASDTTVAAPLQLEEGLGAHATLVARCRLCDLPMPVVEALIVDARGFLCRGCRDAVEVAIAQQRLTS